MADSSELGSENLRGFLDGFCFVLNRLVKKSTTDFHNAFLDKFHHKFHRLRFQFFHRQFV